jgi:hypothetical protein
MSLLKRDIVFCSKIGFEFDALRHISPVDTFVDTLNEGETGLNCLSFSFSLGIQGKQRG